MEIDLDALLAWCLENIGCDACSKPKGAKYQPMHGNFLCDSDATLVQTLFRAKQEEDGTTGWFPE